MKTRIAFLALIVLLTLTSCGDDFDAEAEKEAVMAVSVGLDEDIANADREAVLAAIHEDFTEFFSFPPDYWWSATIQDFPPDAFTEPEKSWWDDYEVLVSPDLAVIKGNRTVDSPESGHIHAFATYVFVKEDGEWKFIHAHVSQGGS